VKELPLSSDLYKDSFKVLDFVRIKSKYCRTVSVEEFVIQSNLELENVLK